MLLLFTIAIVLLWRFGCIRGMGISTKSQILSWIDAAHSLMPIILFSRGCGRTCEPGLLFQQSLAHLLVPFLLGPLGYAHYMPCPPHITKIQLLFIWWLCTGCGVGVQICSNSTEKPLLPSLCCATDPWQLCHSFWTIRCAQSHWPDGWLFVSCSRKASRYVTGPFSILAVWWTCVWPHASRSCRVHPLGAARTAAISPLSDDLWGGMPWGPVPLKQD